MRNKPWLLDHSSATASLLGELDPNEQLIEMAKGVFTDVPENLASTILDDVYSANNAAITLALENLDIEQNLSLAETHLRLLNPGVDVFAAEMSKLKEIAMGPGEKMFKGLLDTPHSSHLETVETSRAAIDELTGRNDQFISALGIDFDDEIKRIHSLASASIISNEELARNVLSSSFVHEFNDLNILAEQTKQNILSASSLFGQAEIPNISALLGDITQDSMDLMLSNMSQWYRASDAMAELAQTIADVPYDIREGWFSDPLDIYAPEIHADDAYPLGPDEITENIDQDIKDVKKGKMPKWLLSYLKDPKSYVQIVGLYLATDLVVNIDNSNTVINFKPQVNLTVESESKSRTNTISNGVVKTQSKNGNVFLRNGPGLEYTDDAIKIPNRTFVTVLESRSQWANVFVIVNNKTEEGWIALKYIHFFEPSPKI